MVNIDLDTLTTLLAVANVGLKKMREDEFAGKAIYPKSPDECEDAIVYTERSVEHELRKML